MFDSDKENKQAEVKRRHVESVIRKRLDYLSRGLCITHGTKLASGSKWRCMKCLRREAEKARKRRAKRKGNTNA